MGKDPKNIPIEFVDLTSVPVIKVERPYVDPQLITNNLLEVLEKSRRKALEAIKEQKKTDTTNGEK